VVIGVGRKAGLVVAWLAVAAAGVVLCGNGGTARAEERERWSRTSVPDEEDSLAVVEVQRVVRAAEAQLESGQPIVLEFADDSDWLLTKSGEWLRGGVDWMRDDIMEFDSVEFGALEINMRDVVGIHAPHRDTYIFRDRSSLQGRAMLTTTEVIVETENGIEIRPRAELWAIVEGGAREVDYWSFRTNLGFSANAGNSSQINFNFGFQVSREDRRTLTELGYLLNLGRSEGEQSVARHIVLFLNKVWIDEVFFVQPMVGQLLSDRFQDITFRAQPAAAVGVRFLNKPRAWWNLTTGLGYQYLSLYRPFPGIEDPHHDGLVRFGTRARFDMTDDIYLTLNWATNLTYTTIGNTNHTGTAELFIEVTNILNINTSFLFLRTEEPYPRENGSVPRKNDYFFVMGLTLQLG
jgi:hypothetical protein